MKVTGETLSLFKKEKEPKGQFLSFRKTHTEFTLKNDFLISLGRIFQAKGQSKRVIY